MDSFNRCPNFLVYRFPVIYQTSVCPNLFAWSHTQFASFTRRSLMFEWWLISSFSFSSIYKEKNPDNSKQMTLFCFCWLALLVKLAERINSHCIAYICLEACIVLDVLVISWPLSLVISIVTLFMLVSLLLLYGCRLVANNPFCCFVGGDGAIAWRWLGFLLELPKLLTNFGRSLM